MKKIKMSINSLFFICFHVLTILNINLLYPNSLIFRVKFSEVSQNMTYKAQLRSFFILYLKNDLLLWATWSFLKYWSLEIHICQNGFKCFFKCYLIKCWRRKQQPAPVFLPRESCGQKNLVGCRLLGRTESDTTEAT